MTALAVALLLGHAAKAAAVAALPADRIEKLTQDPKGGELLCAGGRSWCATISEREGEPRAVVISEGKRTLRIDLPASAPAEGFDDRAYQLWPARIRFGSQGDYLIGVIDEHRTMYSGGGAHSGTLTLYHVTAADGSFRDVLSVPWDSGAMIRACFSEKDYRQRAGACHDEYDYSASLEVAGAGAGSPPPLRYRARATSYPGRVSRSEDSLAGKPLRKRDLVRAVDPECSFSRQLSYDAATGSYTMNQSLPACEDYLQP